MRRQLLRLVALFVILFPALAAGNYSDAERAKRLTAIVQADLAKLPPQDIEWLKKQAAKTKAFEKKISHVKAKKILRRLKKLSKPLVKPALIGNSKVNRSKNVHNAPFDETRALRDIPGFYISASDVLTPQQAYVVGEEPMPYRLSNFWSAIICMDAKTIVALCMPLGSAYFHDNYYPMQTPDGWIISKIKEEVVSVSPFKLAQRVVLREFWAMKGSYRRVINHIHVENWPDHDAIDGSLFNWLLAYVEYLNPESGLPIFVHCAAGVGRSGTFVAAHSICKEISVAQKPRELEINIPMRILELRMQRKNQLSQEAQLNAVINAVRERVRGI